MTDQPRHHVALDGVYDFLPEDENEVAVDSPGAEDTAVHTIPDSPRHGVRDPGRSESAIGDESDEERIPTSWFEDEEHEGERTPEDLVEFETADVDDVLIAQHYAFETESENEDVDNEAVEQAEPDVED